MQTVLTLRIDENVKENLRAIAKNNSRSMSKQVEHFILMEQAKLEKEKSNG